MALMPPSSARIGFVLPKMGRSFFLCPVPLHRKDWELAKLCGMPRCRDRIGTEPASWGLVGRPRSLATATAIGSARSTGEITDATTGVHCRAWWRCGMADGGAGAAAGGGGDWVAQRSGGTGND